MAIPILTGIETCYDMFDVMITRCSALEFIIGRYIHGTCYYIIMLIICSTKQYISGNYYSIKFCTYVTYTMKHWLF